MLLPKLKEKIEVFKQDLGRLQRRMDTELLKASVSILMESGKTLARKLQDRCGSEISKCQLRRCGLLLYSSEKEAV